MVSDEQKERLKKAYDDFHHKASLDQRKQVRSMMHKAHQQTHDMCAGVEGSASADQGVDFAIGKIIKEKMAEALEDGMESKDWSAIHEITRKRAGL